MSSPLKFRRLATRVEKASIIVDIGMILLVCVNLALILFDGLFHIGMFRDLLASLSPGFHDLYRDTVHANFLLIDLCFVAVYLTEFSIRWVLAIVNRTHHRWFFFPFVRWYDLLGCIPIGAFRWLRILRIISLLHRLQRIGLIDLSQTYIGQTVIKYYSILVEEISDRVVINVLNGAQDEIRLGSPLFHRIESDVLRPRQDAIVGVIARRVANAVAQSHQHFQQPLADYLMHLTDEAILRTSNGRRLAAIPVAGPRAINLLKDNIREIGVALLDQLADDISAENNRDALKDIINELIEAGTGDGEHLNELIRDTIIDVLDQVKTQVAVKKWQDNYQ